MSNVPKPAETDVVWLYTDGACSGNPGPGGWAFILKHPGSGQVRDASGAEPHTTNNRMELAGAIEGLAFSEDELARIEPHAGHGLTYRNVTPVARLEGMGELNIGHSIVSRAVLVGFSQAVREMKALL